MTRAELCRRYPGRVYCVGDGVAESLVVLADDDEAVGMARRLARRQGWQDFFFVVVNEHFRESDVALFFHPDDPVVRLPAAATLADVAVRAGLFPSKSAARRNGWARPIPAGWSEYARRQKRRVRWFLYKPVAAAVCA